MWCITGLRSLWPPPAGLEFRISSLTKKKLSEFFQWQFHLILHSNSIDPIKKCLTVVCQLVLIKFECTFSSKFEAMATGGSLCTCFAFYQQAMPTSLMFDNACASGAEFVGVDFRSMSNSVGKRGMFPKLISQPRLRPTPTTALQQEEEWEAHSQIIRR